MAYDIIVGRNESDRKKFGEQGVVFIGKGYVKMGRTTSLSNRIFLDVVRSHVVLVCGKRGCLTEDTLIFTDKGYKKIKNFDEEKDKIYSFNKKKGIFELEKSKLLNYDVDEDLITIKLIDGQELTATSEHPFLVKSGKTYSWKIASELTAKDKIVSVLNLPEKEGTESINKEIARLLGFVLADGTLFVHKGRFKDGKGYWYNGTKKRLRIINAENEVLECARNDLRKEFKIEPRRYERKEYNCEVIETMQQRVVDKFIQLGIPAGKKSDIIRVPESIYSASKNVHAQFLKALFSCDGTINKNGERIEYYSNSCKFLNDVKLILGHFGIHGRVREKETTCRGKKFLSYALSFCDYKSMKNFEKNIGFFSKEKRARLKKRKFWRMNRRKKTEYISDDLFFEDIKRVSKKKCKTVVYDLRVPKNHSFIANGVISHNSGKSYTLGTICEGICNLPEDVAKNIAVIIFDTMGIFWTMKYPNEKDEDLLKQWGLKPEGLNKVDIYVPEGYYKTYKEEGIPADYSFSIKPNELTPEDWRLTFGLGENDPLAIAIEKVLYEFQEKGIIDYSIEDITKAIDRDADVDINTKNAAKNRFKATKGWGVFQKEGTKVSDMIQGGKISVLDLSAYTTGPGGWGVKSLVTGLITKKIFIERTIERKKEEVETIKAGYSYIGSEEEYKKTKKPMVWLVLDEAHEFLPEEGKTAATDALITILREGRQPGVSTLLATQQPGKIHRDVMTQTDLVISHRVTARQDVDALNAMMQSYMTSTLVAHLNNLPRESGAAVILDDNSERIYPMRVRPRFTWHGGEAPTAITYKKKLDLGI